MRADPQGVARSQVETIPQVFTESHSDPDFLLGMDAGHTTNEPDTSTWGWKRPSEMRIVQ